MCVPAGGEGQCCPAPRRPGGGPGRTDRGGRSERLEVCPEVGAAESPGRGGALGTPSCLVVGDGIQGVEGHL